MKRTVKSLLSMMIILLLGAGCVCHAQETEQKLYVPGEGETVIEPILEVPDYVLKLLDVGVKGLIVPNVQSVEDVKTLISYAKYYPLGERGFCPTRKDGWGFDMPEAVPEIMRRFNEETLLIPQCETVGALEAIEEIAALDGVDGVFVGPFDLSISMGIPGQFQSEAFQTALTRILRACHEAGKFCLFFGGTKEAVQQGFARGFDGMAYGIDTMLFIELLRDAFGAVGE